MAWALWWSYGGGVFLMSEVPLWIWWEGFAHAQSPPARSHIANCRGKATLKGYLAHEKHPPVGPCSSPMPRDL